MIVSGALGIVLLIFLKNEVRIKHQEVQSNIEIFERNEIIKYHEQRDAVPAIEELE